MTPFYLGLPQWQHPHWKKIGLHTLADYAHYFNCVEGNTTLYALPRPEIVQPWLFIHTPDIAFAPDLVQYLWPALRQAVPQVGDAPGWPQQDRLF